MNDFLKSIKVIQSCTVTLRCPKSYFLKQLEANVGPPGFEFFESFTKGRPYKGTVSGNQFRIRQRSTTFNNMGHGFTIITGSVTERDDKSIIDMEIHTRNWYRGMFFIVIIAFLGASAATYDNGPFLLISLSAVLLQLIFVAIIMIYGARRLVKLTKSNIEKDLYFLVKDYSMRTDF